MLSIGTTFKENFMPSSFENLPESREHSDDSAVAEAVQRELQARGEQTPNITDLAGMLDPKDINSYEAATDDAERQALMKKMVASVLAMEAHF